MFFSTSPRRGAQMYTSLRPFMVRSVDTLTLNFKDLLGMKPVPNNPNFRDGVAPHIWNYNGKVECSTSRRPISRAA